MRRRSGLGILLVLCILAGMLLEPSEQVQAKKKLSDYSTRTYCWGLGQNTRHQKPAGSGPRGWKLKKYNAYYVGPHSKKDKVVYLSFDCGYEAGYTKRILNTLKKYKVKAIFFVTEAYIKETPKLVKRMKREGHLVGNHTCTHPQMSKLGVKRLKREILQCARTMKKLTGYEMDKFIRPPEGNFSMRSVKVAQSLGYATIFWSLAYYDYDTNRQPGKEYVINRFKTYYHNGMIPLIHAVSKSNTQALPTVIKYLKKKGFRYGTLDEIYPKEEEENIEEES